MNFFKEKNNLLLIIDDVDVHIMSNPWQLIYIAAVHVPEANLSPDPDVCTRSPIQTLPKKPQILLRVDGLVRKD